MGSHTLAFLGVFALLLGLTFKDRVREGHRAGNTINTKPETIIVYVYKEENFDFCFEIANTYI